MFTMSVREAATVSAQVILIPASGQLIDCQTLISAANLSGFLPPPNALSATAAQFLAGGFEVGPLMGISFSVTGTIAAFEAFFGLGVRLAGDRGYEFAAGDESVGHELSGPNLPAALRHLVQAVVFPLQPDFGPTEFY
jgi:hypothetical protein